MSSEPEEYIDILSAAAELENLCTSWLMSRAVAETVYRLGETVARSIYEGGKVFFAGNGGSFSDAQHMAAELIGKLSEIREPYGAIALGSNPAAVSAIANDLSWEKSILREFQALAKEGDVLVMFSTSGQSSNLLELPKLANRIGASSFAFLGKSGGILGSYVDCLVVPSLNTQRVQEMHTFLGHEVCRIIERLLGEYSLSGD